MVGATALTSGPDQSVTGDELCVGFRADDDDRKMPGPIQAKPGDIVIPMPIVTDLTRGLTEPSGRAITQKDNLPQEQQEQPTDVDKIIQMAGGAGGGRQRLAVNIPPGMTEDAYNELLKKSAKPKGYYLLSALKT